jgi:hypothetical protein
MARRSLLTGADRRRLFELPVGDREVARHYTAIGRRRVGRIERTLFTLDWPESPELRQRCQAGINKSEARHALAQAVFVHKQGRIADRTLQNQEHRASGLNLVIATIALWNTLYMERAVDHLRARDVAAPGALLAYLSPMGWAHVSLTGDYLWAAAQSDGGFRPLNDPADTLYRAA